MWKEVRQLLQAVAECQASEIELKTALGTLFPKSSRYTDWKKLRAMSPYRIPDLDYPFAVRATGLALSLCMVLAETFHVWQVAGANWLWPMLGLLGIWMISETYLKLLPLFARWRYRFRGNMTTVKELCRIILASNYEKVSIDANMAYDGRCLRVWSELTEILVDTLGVDHDAITFRSGLVKDLGMD